MKRALLGLGTLLVAALVAEGLLRLLDLPAEGPQPRRLYHVREHGEKLVGEWGSPALIAKSEDPVLREVRGELLAGLVFKTCYDLASGSRPGFDANGCVTYEINADHLRGPLVPKERTAGVARIAAVGDSFTFGDGVPFESAWPARLAQISGAEVVNLGVPGYSVKDVHTYATGKAPRWSPDRLVYGFYLNDVLTQEDRGAEILAAAAPEPSASRLVDWWRRRGAGTRLSVATRSLYLRAYGLEEPATGEWELCQKYLRKIAAAAPDRLVLAIFPELVDLDGEYPYEGAHVLLRDWCASNGVVCVDLLEVYRGRRAQDLWVHVTDHHPNEEAQALAAEAIARALAR